MYGCEYQYGVFVVETWPSLSTVTNTAVQVRDEHQPALVQYSVMYQHTLMGSETHHLPVTLSGVQSSSMGEAARGRGRWGLGPYDFAYLLRTELCAEDNTEAVSIQPPWRHGWGSPWQVAVYGLLGGLIKEPGSVEPEPLDRQINGD